MTRLRLVGYVLAVVGSFVAGWAMGQRQIAVPHGYAFVIHKQSHVIAFVCSADPRMVITIPQGS